MGLPLPWVRHLKDPEAKKNFEGSIRASTTALSRLYDLLEETEKNIQTNESREADFDSGAWAFKQAFRNGQKAQIKELKQLLGFIKE